MKRNDNRYKRTSANAAQPGRPAISEVPFPISSERLGLEPNAKWYLMGEEIQIIVGSTLQDGWHMSIYHPKRYPTWDEIAHARYKLIPGNVTMAMLLPPIEQYVNLHPNCFHLWQTPGLSDAQ